MGQKLFSVITPVFNSGPKIEKTINSVLSQDEDLFEFVVVDGGSTDDTLEVVEKYAGRIKLLSEKDEGVYDAMNHGVDAAGGKFLYFLGAGDSLKPGALSTVAARLPPHEHALVYGNVYMIDEGRIYDGEFDRAKLRRRNICQQAIFYGREIFGVTGGFETRFSVLADHAFNLKCFFNHRIEKKYIAYVIANYEGGGISRTERDLDFALEYGELMSVGGE
jgi:glycosyltransferase involved in cell wall biosynthesis